MIIVTPNDACKPQLCTGCGRCSLLNVLRLCAGCHRRRRGLDRGRLVAEFEGYLTRRGGGSLYVLDRSCPA